MSAENFPRPLETSRTITPALVNDSKLYSVCLVPTQTLRRDNIALLETHCQCAGTFPSHSTPESL